MQRIMMHGGAKIKTNNDGSRVPIINSNNLKNLTHCQFGVPTLHLLVYKDTTAAMQGEGRRRIVIENDKSEVINDTLFPF